MLALVLFGIAALATLTYFIGKRYIQRFDNSRLLKPMAKSDVPPADFCKKYSTTKYTIKYDWKGVDIIPSSQAGWEFFVGVDPTRGHVNYDKWDYLVSKIGDDAIRIDVDQYPVPEGRRSIRLITKDKEINPPKGGSILVIIDAAHIPEGKSVWPAFWMVGIPTDEIQGKTLNRWACYGEIDIIEGANSTPDSPDSNINLTSLHTNNVPGTDECYQSNIGINQSKCSSSSSPLYTCGCNGNERCPNEGCGLKKGAFGNAFNSVGGGVYACRLTSNGKVDVWSFARGDIPEDIRCSKPNPASWSSHNNNHVDFKACPGHFKNLMLVINTTICGEWAGSVFGGPPTSDQQTLDNVQSCNAFAVDPQNTYDDAFWYINYIKLFESSDEE